MAIFGTLATIEAQCNKALFQKCFDFLKNTNLEKVFHEVEINKPIEIEIDGKNAFAIFQTYDTKSIADAKMEGHKKYIDIQYIHKGTEQILISSTGSITEADNYDSSKDVFFRSVTNYSNIVLNNGDACILYPDDLHAPCISTKASSKVEKIVIKVSIHQK